MDDLCKEILLIGALGNGSLTALQDYFKIFMGFPTTGGAAPPQAQK
jgi:solute carrier family 25 phosphate transporter 3